MDARLKSIVCGAAVAVACSSGFGPGRAAQYLPLAGGSFRSVLPPDRQTALSQVAPFAMRSTPVSNTEYRNFIVAHPNWQRGAATALFVGADYLSQWTGVREFVPLDAAAPVTQVSWFAAQAFCESEQARLPRWIEWEFAAAADTQRADARTDPLWLAQILSWYATPANTQPSAIGQHPANFYGLHDLHGLMWEWVEDFNGLFVSADSREQGSQKQLEFCGGAALTLSDRQNYAVLMRLALLAAMDANQAGRYLGFRCVRTISQSGVTP